MALSSALVCKDKTLFGRRSAALEILPTWALLKATKAATGRSKMASAARIHLGRLVIAILRGHRDRVCAGQPAVKSDSTALSYWKYPSTSRMKPTCSPGPIPAYTVMSPLRPTGTIAHSERICPCTEGDRGHVAERRARRIDPQVSAPLRLGLGDVDGNRTVFVMPGAPLPGSPATSVESARLRRTAAQAANSSKTRRARA